MEQLVIKTTALKDILKSLYDNQGELQENNYRGVTEIER